MSVKWTLDGSASIRHFKVALQSLAKIGCDLLVESFPEKNVLATFRTQRMSKMQFELASDGARLAVTIFCDNGLTKRYTIECMDAEMLQAAVEKDTFPTCVIAEAGELHKLLNTFQSNLDEVTIIANPESVVSAANPHKACQLQSFYDPAKGQSASTLHTSLSVDTQAVFLSYTHASEEASDVTFNIKDFRSMVSLCEHLAAQISIRFDQPGVPLVAEPHFRGVQDVELSAELVLATLTETQLTPEHRQQQQQQYQKQQQHVSQHLLQVQQEQQHQHQQYSQQQQQQQQPASVWPLTQQQYQQQQQQLPPSSMWPHSQSLPHAGGTGSLQQHPPLLQQQQQQYQHYNQQQQQQQWHQNILPDPQQQQPARSSPDAGAGPFFDGEDRGFEADDMENDLRQCQARSHTAPGRAHGSHHSGSDAGPMGQDIDPEELPVQYAPRSPHAPQQIQQWQAGTGGSGGGGVAQGEQQEPFGLESDDELLPATPPEKQLKSLGPGVLSVRER